jgi:hypothetical protein
MGEMRLDPSPASGEIVVVRRQRPERMQVLGKNDDRFDGEGRSRRATRKAARRAST